MPGSEKAFIDRLKMRGYLLSETHRRGRHKANLFRSIGFEAPMFQELERELLRVAREDDVVEIEESPWGPMYVVHGMVTAPDGRRSLVKTVWIIDNDDGAPRLVSAMPLEDA